MKKILYRLIKSQRHLMNLEISKIKNLIQIYFL